MSFKKPKKIVRSLDEVMDPADVYDFDLVFSYEDIPSSKIPIWSLPKGLQKLALQAMETQRQENYDINSDMTEAFDWNDSMQGGSFWSLINSYYYHAYHGDVIEPFSHLINDLMRITNYSREELELMIFGEESKESENTLKESLKNRFKILK